MFKVMRRFVWYNGTVYWIKVLFSVITYVNINTSCFAIKVLCKQLD